MAFVLIIGGHRVVYFVYFQAENDILKTEMSFLQSKLELVEQQLLAKNRARIHR